MFKDITYTIILCLIVLTGCSDNTTKKCPLPENTEAIENTYAGLFSAQSYKDGYVLTIQKSWKDNASKTYILSRKKEEVSACSNHITIPAKRIIVLAAGYVYMIDTLEGINSIIGYTKRNQTANNRLLEAIGQGKVKETGEIHEIDIEKIISMTPDVIVINGFGKDNPKIDQLERAGIPVIESIEWMESHPLGRAEWIRVAGVLLDKASIANEIFREIANNYNSLADSIENSLSGARVIYGMKTSGTWYIPGKRSFIGQIMKDANVPYVWNNNSSSGSTPTDMEIILQEQLNDTIWMGPGVSSLEKLEQADERHALFRAFELKNVFHHDKRKGSNNISRYWAESVLRCDLLLNDFITISRKGRNAENLHFYRKLER